MRSPHIISARGEFEGIQYYVLMMTYFELNQIRLIHEMEISVVETTWKCPKHDRCLSCLRSLTKHSHVNQKKKQQFHHLPNNAFSVLHNKMIKRCSHEEQLFMLMSCYKNEKWFCGVVKNTVKTYVLRLPLMQWNGNRKYDVEIAWYAHRH